MTRPSVKLAIFPISGCFAYALVARIIRILKLSSNIDGRILLFEYSIYSIHPYEKQRQVGHSLSFRRPTLNVRKHEKFVIKQFPRWAILAPRGFYKRVHSQRRHEEWIDESNSKKKILTQSNNVTRVTTAKKKEEPVQLFNCELDQQQLDPTNHSRSKDHSPTGVTGTL